MYICTFFFPSHSVKVVALKLCKKLYYEDPSKDIGPDGRLSNQLESKKFDFI